MTTRCNRTCRSSWRPCDKAEHRPRRSTAQGGSRLRGRRSISLGRGGSQIPLDQLCFLRKLLPLSSENRRRRSHLAVQHHSLAYRIPASLRDLQKANPSRIHKDLDGTRSSLGGPRASSWRGRNPVRHLALFLRKPERKMKNEFGSYRSPGTYTSSSFILSGSSRLTV